VAVPGWPPPSAFHLPNRGRHSSQPVSLSCCAGTGATMVRLRSNSAFVLSRVVFILSPSKPISFARHLGVTHLSRYHREAGTGYIGTSFMAESTKQTRTTTTAILNALQEARTRTLDLVSDLDEQQLMGPRPQIVNPLRWEIGHVAFFQEFWCLRHFRGERPILASGDKLYDSARVAHDTRWDLPLPSFEQTLSYMEVVLNRVIELNQATTDVEIDGYGQNYFLLLALFHEQMQAQAVTYTGQP